MWIAQMKASVIHRYIAIKQSKRHARLGSLPSRWYFAGGHDGGHLGLWRLAAFGLALVLEVACRCSSTMARSFARSVWRGTPAS